ncbi:MAG: iron ABC transporter permease [Chloroflexota bacterium]
MTGSSPVATQRRTAAEVGAAIAAGRPFLVRYFPLVVALGIVLTLVLVVAHVSIGTANISVEDVVKVLTGQQVDSTTHTIVYELRLPRALVAVLAGAMLALAGAIMQTVTRNPLAEPDLTGESAGAVFFAVLWLSRDLIYRNVSPPNIGVPIVAMAGSVLTGGLVYVLSRGRDRQSNNVRMVLTGIMISAIFRSLTSLVLLVNQNAANGILMWIIGSLNGVTWSHWNTIWPWAVLTIPLGMACAGAANTLHLGDDIAAGLGMKVERARLLLLFVAVLLTAASVSVVGSLAFLGLIAPHIARRLVGNDARRLFPLSVILGAIILVMADVVARGLTRVLDLPVGAVMAIIGAPFLIYLLRRTGR